MRMGAVFPQIEFGNDTGALKAYIQTVEDLGYTHLLAYDHVLSADTSNRPDFSGPYTLKDPFHEVFVFFGYVAALTQRLELVTGILILPQRQTALVAKQAAEVDVLSNGRFRLGIGVGWNEVEFEGLGESFSNRGVRSEEQMQLMRALWTTPSIVFDGQWDQVVEAGLIRCRCNGQYQSGSAGMPKRPCTASPASATAGSHGANRTRRWLPILSYSGATRARPVGIHRRSDWNRSSMSTSVRRTPGMPMSKVGAVWARPTCASTPWGADSNRLPSTSPGWNAWPGSSAFKRDRDLRARLKPGRIVWRIASRPGRSCERFFGRGSGFSQGVPRTFRENVQ